MKKVFPDEMNTRKKASMEFIQVVTCFSLLSYWKQEGFSKNFYFEIGYKLVSTIENKVKIKQQLKFVYKIYTRTCKQLPNRSQMCCQASQQPKESKKLVLKFMVFK